jgi:hypothetical protein
MQLRSTRRALLVITTGVALIGIAAPAHAAGPTPPPPGPVPAGALSQHARALADRSGALDCGQATSSCRRTVVAPRGKAGPPVSKAQRRAGLARGGAVSATVTGDFWTLQMNLCNSGLAGCYHNGQSVPEAAGIISSWYPDVVTLNEICSANLNTLVDTMANTWYGDWAYGYFLPAWDRGSNAPYKCKNGDQYGIGVIGHVFADQWQDTDAVGGWYELQSSASNEERAWLCSYAIGNYIGCTTHLVSDFEELARWQCQRLMFDNLPAARDYWGYYGPTVVAGDLNLKYGGTYNAQDCVPSGYFRKGDGDVQHTIASTNFTFQDTRKIDMKQTDHDAWLVMLSL